MFLNRKLTQRKCGFKNIVPTAQFQDLGELDRFLMTDLGLTSFAKGGGLAKARSEDFLVANSELLKTSPPPPANHPSQSLSRLIHPLFQRGLENLCHPRINQQLVQIHSLTRNFFGIRFTFPRQKNIRNVAPVNIRLVRLHD